MKKVLIASLLLLAVCSAYGQNKNRGWGGHFDVRTNNGLVMNTLAASAWNYVADSLIKKPWLGCRIEGVVISNSFFVAGVDTMYARATSYRAPFFDNPVYDKEILEYNVSFGYTAGYQWGRLLFINAGLHHEWHSFNFEDSRLAGVHRATYIIPSVGLTLRFGKRGLHELAKAKVKININGQNEFSDSYYESEDSTWYSKRVELIDRAYADGRGVTLDVAGSVGWVQRLDYSGLLENMDVLGSGVRVKFELMLGFLWTQQPVSIGFGYERDLFSYFNVSDVMSSGERLMFSVGMVL